MNDSDQKAATTAPWLWLTDLPSAADPDDVEPAVSVDVPADAPVVELPGCSLLVADSLISSVDRPAVSCRRAAHKQNTMHALRMRKSSADGIWKCRWKYGSASVREGWDGPFRPP